MTTKPVAPPADAAVEKFPDFPPRDDMNNPVYLYDPAHPSALRRHLGSPETTLVLGETPVGWRPSQVSGILIPDLLVAFNIDRAAIIAQDGYAIEERGKPPDFVLEVASKTTARNDDTTKRDGYANYGIPEYWRFDPTGGRYHQTGLAGDQLSNGTYQPIPIERLDDHRYRGYSAILGLYICWEYSQLRWLDPATNTYLRTYDDAENDRLAAETGRLAAEADRLAAEAGRLAAEARIRQLEAEIQRLRNP